MVTIGIPKNEQVVSNNEIKYIKGDATKPRGDERKILAFGMALIHKPKLLLFDEPFAGVDVKNSMTLLSLFNETIINKDNGVIIVEHKDDARQLFTRKIRMELGTLLI